MSKTRYAPILTEDEIILCGLDKVMRARGERSNTAAGLINWFLVNKFWTPEQRQFAKTIAAEAGPIRAKKKRKPENKKYHLYAISDGENIKLGYSSKVSARVEKLQVGHPKSLSVLWTMYVGRSEAEAEKMEKKLHRICGKHRIRGEWFTAECMPMVTAFRLPSPARKSNGVTRRP